MEFYQHSYTANNREIWVSFDLNEEGADEAMRRTFDAFGGRCDLMALDETHPILCVQPGVPTRKTRAS